LDLTSPSPFWLIRNGLGDVPDPLTRDRQCDVVVIGAGVTGALAADALSSAGLSVIALDRRYPGLGSTSASTALLQYELDASISELSDKIGHPLAIDAYRAAFDGVLRVARIARGLREDVGFRKRPSLYYASRSRDEAALREEGEARRRAGFPCRTLEENDVRRIVDVKTPVALWSPTGGEIDPWRLTRALLNRCARRGRFAIYGRTEVSRIAAKKTHVEVETDRGIVRARRVVVAAGYEAEKFLPKRVAKLHSSYAIVTEPVASFEGWTKRCLIWESARPYHYVRTTSDDRIMIGGEDDPFRDPAQRDSRVPKKAGRLLEKVRGLFPRMQLELGCAWAGTFGETDDSLPYIGPHPDRDERVFYALAYGANGIPFAALAAQMAVAAVNRISHRQQRTFAFDRPGT
jgi:glycine/D-amino acid oxidase-like deaminating enzyme